MLPANIVTAGAGVPVLVPLKLKMSGLPALSAKDTNEVFVKFGSTGEYTTLNVQVALGVSVKPVPGMEFVIVAGEPQVLLVSENTALPKLTAVATRFDEPVFWSVTGMGLPDSPAGT